MKFSVVAIFAAAVAGVQAWSNETVVTETVTAFTTFCPFATELTYGGSTYTVTEATTLTITNCPCTVTHAATTLATAKSVVAPIYSNSTAVAPAKSTAVGTTSVLATKTTAPSHVPTAGAGKTVVLSGAGLAGVLGFAALLL